MNMTVPFSSVWMVSYNGFILTGQLCSSRAVYTGTAKAYPSEPAEAVAGRAQPGSIRTADLGPRADRQLSGETCGESCRCASPSHCRPEFLNDPPAIIAPATPLDLH